MTAGFPYLIISEVRASIFTQHVSFPSMPYMLKQCGGGDLQHYLDSNKLGDDVKMKLLAEVADGLASLESQSIVHGFISVR